MQGSFNRYEETSYIGEDAMTDPADTIASAVSGKAVKSAGLRYVPGNGTLCDYYSMLYDDPQIVSAYLDPFLKKHQCSIKNKELFSR